MDRNTPANNGKSRELLLDVFRYGLPCARTKVEPWGVPLVSPKTTLCCICLGVAVEYRWGLPKGDGLKTYKTGDP
jgi:hypothetical protein